MIMKTLWLRQSVFYLSFFDDSKKIKNPKVRREIINDKHSMINSAISIRSLLSTPIGSELKK